MFHSSFGMLIFNSRIEWSTSWSIWKMRIRTNYDDSCARDATKVCPTPTHTRTTRTSYMRSLLLIHACNDAIAYIVPICPQTLCTGFTGMIEVIVQVHHGALQCVLMVGDNMHTFSFIIIFLPLAILFLFIYSHLAPLSHAHRVFSFRPLIKHFHPKNVTCGFMARVSHFFVSCISPSYIFFSCDQFT